MPFAVAGLAVCVSWACYQATLVDEYCGVYYKLKEGEPFYNVSCDSQLESSDFTIVGESRH